MTDFHGSLIVVFLFTIHDPRRNLINSCVRSVELNEARFVNVKIGKTMEFTVVNEIQITLNNKRAF